MITTIDQRLHEEAVGTVENYLRSVNVDPSKAFEFLEKLSQVPDFESGSVRLQLIDRTSPDGLNQSASMTTGLVLESS